MSKRNIIWIMVDQMRSQAMSCHGDPNVSTPNLDTMKSYGIDFPDAVGGFPLCCPYRGALISGVYPHKCVQGHEFQLPPELPTVADVFNDAGYDTAYFGKWHLDGHRERDGRSAMHLVPKERRARFKTWLGYDNNNSQWDSWLHGHRKDEEVPHYRLPGSETDCMTDLLIDYLKEKAEDKEPFFTVMSVQPPHDPYTAPAEYMQKYNPATLEMRPNVPQIPRVQKQARNELAGYYALIENIDYNVGRIIDTLAELKLDEDTICIFFSDHGDMHGSHGQFRKMTPMEESIRVPCMIFGQRTRYAMRTVESNCPVNHVDIAPTSLGICGINVPDWMEGYDYSNILQGQWKLVDAPDSAYLQSVVPTKHGNSVDKPWRGIVTRDGWKYVCFENCEWLMFNLNEDPYEQVNLTHNSIFKGKREELNARLKRWVEETDDTFTIPEVV